MSRFLAVWVPELAWQALRGEARAGQAQVVVEKNGPAPVVVAGNGQARRRGITAGLSWAQARLRDPQCLALERAPGAEQQLQEEMLALLDHFSDRCHALPPDRWLLDLAGMERLLGPAGEIAQRVQAAARERGLAVRCGLAPTRAAALLAVHAGLPPIAGPDPATALAPLPVATLAALQDCGVEAAELCDLFARWGLRTLGAVAALPQRALAERLGRGGLNCRRWARGEDRGLLLPAVTAPPPPALGESFEPALEGYLPLLPWLEQQLRQLAAQWERGDRVCAALLLELQLDGHGGWRHRYAPPLAHRDPRRLLRQLETALALQPPAAPITAAALVAHTLPPRRVQGGLFGDAALEEENRERLLARLRVLLCDPEGRRCGSPRLRDLHRPDAFVMVPWQPQALAREGAAAAAVVRPALRACRPPPPLTLDFPALPAAAEAASPAGAVCHLPRQRPERVERAWGPWRNSGQWWTDGAWSRDEWDVEFAGGRRSRLLFDRRLRRWFLLGAYD
jgi:protein ImuB